MTRLLVALVAFLVAVGATTVWTLQRLRRAPPRDHLPIAGLAVAGYVVAVLAMVL